MKRVITLALLVALSVTGGASGAPPAQTDARTGPVRRGPLTLSDNQCNRVTERDQGQLVAYTRSCIRLYTFNPNRETNSQRDYGITWLQTNVNAENGWCARTVRTNLRIPGNVTIHKRNPIPEQTKTVRRVVTNKLVTNAGGNANSSGSLRQRYVFNPRRQTRTLVNQGATQRLSWFGSSDRKLFFQTGVVFSWNTNDEPGEFRSGLSYRFEKKNNC